MICCDHPLSGEGVDRQREPQPSPVLVRPRRRQRRTGLPRNHSSQEDLGVADPESEVQISLEDSGLTLFFSVTQIKFTFLNALGFPQFRSRFR